LNQKLNDLLLKKSFFIISIILLIILIVLFVITQGLLWYIVNIFLYVSILLNLWLLYFRNKSYLNKLFLKNTKKDEKTLFNNLIDIFIGILLLFGCILFLSLTPGIKGILNENYLHEVFDNIVLNKNTDQEKIDSLLKWFDRNSDNMYNSWFLVHQEKTLLTLIPNHFFIFREMPYFCIRCNNDMDGKWILTSRCGACDEYSRIFMYMIDNLGLDVKRVHAPGEDHIWNEVKIDGAWISVDPTNVSIPNGGDGWEDYGFFEHKEGNASLVWAEYLHNDTIEDLTYLYTNITNITLHCINENNELISDMKITIISHNLRREPTWETYIKGQSKPKTNETGICIFKIGGGNYTFRAENDDYKGEIKCIEFSDQKPSYEFIVNVTKK
jgi:hypothetical protein